MHPSRDEMCFGQKKVGKRQSTTSHDVLEPLKQALLASRDVIIAIQTFGSKLQRVFELGGGLWLPNCLFQSDLVASWKPVSICLHDAIEAQIDNGDMLIDMR